MLKSTVMSSSEALRRYAAIVQKREKNKAVASVVVQNKIKQIKRLRYVERQRSEKATL